MLREEVKYPLGDIYVPWRLMLPLRDHQLNHSAPELVAALN
jgi:hypothetical protein